MKKASNLSAPLPATETIPKEEKEEEEDICPNCKDTGLDFVSEDRNMEMCYCGTCNHLVLISKPKAMEDTAKFEFMVSPTIIESGSDAIEQLVEILEFVEGIEKVSTRNAGRYNEKRKEEEVIYFITVHYEFPETLFSVGEAHARAFMDAENSF